MSLERAITPGKPLVHASLGLGELNYFDARKEHKAALDNADNILATADREGRALTDAESVEVAANMAAAKKYSARIDEVQATSTLRNILPNEGMVIAEGRRHMVSPERMLSGSYYDDFHRWIGSNGQEVGAALYEGSNPAGGYAVPSMVDGTIVPLAPQEMAVRQLASVIPTVMDIKLPRKGSFGVANAKAENAAFVESDPTLEQFTLSALMVGNQETIS